MSNIQDRDRCLGGDLRSAVYNGRLIQQKSNLNLAVFNNVFKYNLILFNNDYYYRIKICYICSFNLVKTAVANLLVVIAERNYC